jgi:hypothetical protein
MTNSNRTLARATAFCAALAETCNVGQACKAIAMGRTTAYDWRDSDPDFAAAWDRAVKVGVSALEDEVHRRAFEGVEEPIVHQGQFSYQWGPAFDEDGAPIKNDDGSLKMVRVLDADGRPKLATIRKYSDSLAMFMLKAHAPDKYRENSKVELSGSLDLQRLTDEELDEELQKLAALEAAGALSPTGGDDADGADDLV